MCCCFCWQTSNRIPSELETWNICLNTVRTTVKVFHGQVPLGYVSTSSFKVRHSSFHMPFIVDLRLSQTIIFSVETNRLVKWQQSQAVHPHNCTAKIRWDSRLAHITTLQLLQAIVYPVVSRSISSPKNCGKVAKICRFVNHTSLSLRLIIFDTNYI